MSSRVSFTPLGWRLAAALAWLLVVGLVFRDPLLSALPLLLGAASLYMYTEFHHAAMETQISLHPASVEERGTAGETFNVSLRVESDGMFRLKPPISGSSFKEDHVRGGSEAVLSFTPELSGTYVSEALKAEATSRLGLFKSSRSTPLRINLKVYPRVYAVALEAANILNEMVEPGTGEQVSQLRGPGVEYAETRPYVQGDAPRQLDWKASARTGSLMSKQFYMDGVTRVHVMYQKGATDPVCLDQLAAGFLQTVLSLAQRVDRFTLIVLEDGEVSIHQRDIPSQRALELALTLSLEGQVAGFQEYYRLLSPSSGLRNLRVFDALQLDVPFMHGGLRKAPLYSMLEAQEGWAALYLVSSLSLDPTALIEAAEHAYRSDWETHLLQPTTPWLSAEEPERIRSHLDRMYRVFTSMGSTISMSAAELSEVTQISR